jgi:hypothetical protein
MNSHDSTILHKSQTSIVQIPLNKTVRKWEKSNREDEKPKITDMQTFLDLQRCFMDHGFLVYLMTALLNKIEQLL